MQYLFYSYLEIRIIFTILYKYINLYKLIMEENFDTFQVEDYSLEVKNSLPTKFMKELNFKENQRKRRQQRKVQVNVISKIRELISGQVKQASIKKNTKKSIKLTECWIDGVKIIGQKKGGQWNGDMAIYYPNGAKFIGKYHHGVKIYGTFDFNNGYVYTGGFLGDKFCGEGQITIPSGKTVKGDWKDNSIQGKAHIKYPTGQIYYGQTLNFKKHGHGYLFLNDGYKYVGQFQHGKITGEGQYFLQQELVGRGFWNDGILVTPLKEGEQFMGNMITISDIANDSNQFGRQSSMIASAQSKYDSDSDKNSILQKNEMSKKSKFQHKNKKVNTEESSVHSKSDDRKTANFYLQTETDQNLDEIVNISNQQKTNSQLFSKILGFR